MKILILLFIMFFVSCDIEQTAEASPKIEELSVIGKKLVGKHELRKIYLKNSATLKSEGYFFIIFGNYQTTSNITTDVTFSWLDNDSIYNINTLPLSKIKIKIDNTVNIPYIKFCWQYQNSPSPKSNLMEFVYYAVIICKDSDWSYNVNLDQIGNPPVEKMK